MNRSLLTLVQAQRHLRVDSTDGISPGDAEILEMIEDASEAILAYLKEAAFLNEDGTVPVSDTGNPIIPANVRAAVKLQLGYLYEHRDEDKDGAYQSAGLPEPVKALLQPLRVPTLA